MTKADREQVARTYGHICHLCGYVIEQWSEFTADHVKPVTHGGNTLLANMRPAHKTCNEFRGDRHLTPVVRAECRVRYERLILNRRTA